MTNKVILSLGVALLLLFILPLNVLGAEFASPRGSKSCQPTEFFDSHLTPLTDKSDSSINRLVDSRELVLRELKTNYTTDLNCSGLQIYSTFDLALQHKVAQELLSFAASHSEIKDGAVLVCNSTGGYWKAAAAIKDEMANLITLQEELSYLCTGNSTIAQIISKDGKVLFEKDFNQPKSIFHLPYHFLVVNGKQSNLMVVPAKTDNLMLVSLNVEQTEETNTADLGKELISNIENLFLEGGEK